MAQFDPEPAYDPGLAERVIAYLQTRDSRLFPFVEGFDEDQLKAFMHDLRVGLSDLTETGSKRATSASGFILSDRRLHEIVQEWAGAGGRWPIGSDPRDPFTALTAAEADPDEAPDIDKTSDASPG